MIFLRNAMASFESDYSETEKLSIDLKVHSKKAQLLLDSARASFYLACASGQTGNHANDCLNTCNSILATYWCESPQQDYAQYAAQADQLAKVHSVLVDTMTLKLRCLVTAMNDTAAAETFLTNVSSILPFNVVSQNQNDNASTVQA